MNVKAIFLIFMLVCSLLFSSEKFELTQEEQQYIKNNPIITYSEVNWKPLSIIENNQMKGIMGDYLELVRKRTGFVFKYIPSTSWPDVLDQFSQGKIDLVPGIGASPQEMKLGLISKTYADYPMVIVTGKKYSYFNDVGELHGKVIAVPKYYTSYNFLVENYPDIKLITTTSIPEALMLVESGRADAFVGHIATSLYYISSLHLENLKISGKTKFIFEHKYLIHKEDPILLSIINKAFDSITNIERKEIYSKWIQTTITEEKIDYELILEILLISLVIVLVLLYRHYSLTKLNKELHNAKNEIEGILDGTMEAILISEENIIVDVNQAAIQLFACESKSEMIGKKLFDFVASDSQKLLKDNLHIDSVAPYEITGTKKDGTTFLALAEGNNIQLQGKIKRISSVIDITEIKEKEQLLLNQSKLASMGEMIGNIAHQWRQPLSAISMTLSSIKLEKELGMLSDEEINKKIEDALKFTNQLSTTIETFRNFIRGNNEKEDINVIKIINQSLDIIAPSLRSKNIRIIHNLTDENSVILNIVSDELTQVFMNILNNAKDVLTKDENIQDRWIDIEMNKTNEMVIITIEDNGGGIEENVLPHIFEPYFTTKHKFQGTGLGLHMSYKIVTESIGGKIYAKNTPSGAKFFIEIPLENKH